MLIDVFAGREAASATPIGSYHFARSPQPGEHVEVDGESFIVIRAWHCPSAYFKGAKFAILMNEEVDDAQPKVPVHDAQAVS